MSKGIENIRNIVSQIGLWETKKIMGISLTKLVKILGMSIESGVGMANEIIIENINNGNLPTEYKEFKISTNSDGVVYWEGKFYGEHFLPNMVETIWVMATPFWDGMTWTPVETDWYSLVNGDDNILIAEIEGGGDYYEQLNEVDTFSNVDDLFSWYEKVYLPSVYEIIMDNFLPKLRQDMDDRLDDNEGYSPMRESIVRALREETEESEKFDKIKHFIKTANKLFSKLKFEAVKRVEFEYDERIEGYNVNIFYDRQFAIDNPKNFNKVKQNFIKEIGSIVTRFFPFKFFFYLYSE